MRILVVGGGGREHALVWKIAASPLVQRLYCAPGNAGIAETATCVDIAAEDIGGLLAFARDQRIDLTVCGPEMPLTMGIADAFEEAGLKLFGPSRRGAEIEGSKIVAKRLLYRHAIPTAQFRVFDRPADAHRYVDSAQSGLVIKADGLAAGKGSVVCSSQEEALSTIDRIMVSPRLFGPAGNKIEIEERLEGRELMFFALSDGEAVLPLQSAMDYKQAYAADEGVAIRLFNKLSGNPNLDNNPNTGGMGGFSPHPWLDEELTDKIIKRIAVPTVRGFKEATAQEYTGVIYFGLMISEEKDVHVLEINVRLGDPEAEVILPRLKTDFYQLSMAMLDRRLRGVPLEWSPNFCLGVCATSGRAIKPLSSGGSERPGYPGEHYTNMPISGLEKVDPDVLVYHNGTAFGNNAQGKRRLFTTGGRVLTLVARGRTLAEARNRAYDNIKRIRFNGMRYRKDIGLAYL